MAASIDSPGDNRLFGRPLADDTPADQPPESPSSLWTANDWSLPRDPTAASPSDAVDEDSPWARPGTDAQLPATPETPDDPAPAGPPVDAPDREPPPHNPD
jgi:hypothetical protein